MVVRPRLHYRTVSEPSDGRAQTEQMLGIAMGELCKVFLAQYIRQTVEKGPAARVRAVGVIDGEKETINADYLEAQRKGGRVK